MQLGTGGGIDSGAGVRHRVPERAQHFWGEVFGAGHLASLVLTAPMMSPRLTLGNTYRAAKLRHQLKAAGSNWPT